MNDKIQGPPPTVSARRRLLRGAFGAPAVLTLYSGSVAATSLSLCVAKAAADPRAAPPVPTVTANPAAYLSVRMWQLRKTSDNSVADGDYFVRGNDLVAFKRNSTGAAYLPAGSVQRFTVSNNTAGVITGSNPVPPSGFVFELSPKYVAVRVNAQGTVVGVGTGTGTAVGGTCWNSFAAIP